MLSTTQEISTSESKTLTSSHFSPNSSKKRPSSEEPTVPAKRQKTTYKIVKQIISKELKKKTLLEIQEVHRVHQSKLKQFFENRKTQKLEEKKVNFDSQKVVKKKRIKRKAGEPSLKIHGYCNLDKARWIPPRNEKTGFWYWSDPNTGISRKFTFLNLSRNLIKRRKISQTNPEAQIIEKKGIGALFIDDQTKPFLTVPDDFFKLLNENQQKHSAEEIEAFRLQNTISDENIIQLVHKTRDALVSKLSKKKIKNQQPEAKDIESKPGTQSAAATSSAESSLSSSSSSSSSANSNLASDSKPLVTPVAAASSSSTARLLLQLNNNQIVQDPQIFLAATALWSMKRIAPPSSIFRGINEQSSSSTVSSSSFSPPTTLRYTMRD